MAARDASGETGEVYLRLIRRYLREGVIAPGDAVFVQFAGTFDEQVCTEAGLTNCTFGNIAPGSSSTGETSATRFDAHRMPQEDGAFDHVFAHSGLHHCSRPHEALHEMYRLARKTVLFVENQDSLFMRGASLAGIVEWFELPAVVAGNYTSGGVDGTGVPNFVYRWTRREVRKTVNSFDPGHDVPIDFHEEWNVGQGRTAGATLARKLHLQPAQAERLLGSAHTALNRFAARQGNIFAATIRKDLATLQPWMRSDDAMYPAG